MLIAGTGGLGIEILGILIQDDYPHEIFFYDDKTYQGEKLFGKYPVISGIENLKIFFKNHSKEFIVGIGNPRIREKVVNKIVQIGGEFSSVISQKAHIFHYNQIAEGCIIQPGVGMSHGIETGIGCAFHIHSSIGHSTKIGKYVNIGPAVTIIGPCEIGDYAYIGADVLVMPNFRIGKNAIVQAGSKVTRDVLDCESYE
ncbi:MAG: hexapeptide transferase [Bacteroidota bacterium]